MKKNNSNQELETEKKKEEQLHTSVNSALNEKHKRANDFIQKVKLGI